MQKPIIQRTILISVVIVLLLTAILLVPTFYDTYFSTKTVSGMTLLKTNVGGKTLDEISKLLDEEIAKPKNIKIQIQEKTIDLDLNSAGFMIDKEKTLEKISKNGKKNFFEAIRIKIFKGKITVEIKADKTEYNTVMDKLLEKEGLIGKSFDYEVLRDKVQIKINSNLRKVNKDKLFEEILASYNDLKDIYIIDTEPTALPTASEIKKEIDIPVIDAKFEKINGTSKVTPHQVGIELLEQELQKMLDNKEVNFSVGLKVLNPKVYTDDLGNEAFPNLLYKFSTNYNSGEISRTQNVTLAASKVNGTILNYNDVFSFNKVVGKRSYENGFKDAKIFLANKVIDDVGGGICQVSSTLYNAVLYSDLKIIERRNHNFVVSYAKPGFDATVSYGSIDFKFQNIYKNPIKIKAVAVGGVMTVSIYGTKENSYKIELSSETLSQTERPTEYEFSAELKKGETKVKQKGSDGFKIKSFRIVKDSDGTVIRTDNLGQSNYVPLAKIIQTSDTSAVKTDQAQVPQPSATPLPTATNTPSVSSSPKPTEVPTQSPNPTQQPIASTEPTPATTIAPIQTPAPVQTQQPIPTQSIKP